MNFNLQNHKLTLEIDVAHSSDESNQVVKRETRNFDENQKIDAKRKRFTTQPDGK